MEQGPLDTTGPLLDRNSLRWVYVKDHIGLFCTGVGGMIGGLYLLFSPEALAPTTIGQASWLLDVVKVGWVLCWALGSAAMTFGMARLRSDLECFGCFTLAAVYALTLVATIQVRGGPDGAFIGVIYISSLTVGHFLRGIFVYQAFIRGRALVWAVKKVRESGSEL